MANDQPIIASTSIAQLESAIRVAAETHTPLVGMGEPGLGKTAIMKQAAAKYGYQYTEMVLGGRDIGDVMLPYIQPGNGLAHHYNPNLPIEGNPRFNTATPILLNFDELDKANRLMQSVMLKVLDEWLVGEAKLLDNVVIVATANRLWDLAGGETFSTALANRCTVINFEVDVDFWLDWGMANNIHPLVLANVKFDPRNLSDFNKTAYMAGDYAYPTCRSNEKLSRICHAYDAKLMDDRLFRAEVCGTIGMAHGTKFVTYAKMQSKMPRIQDILEGKKAHIPEDPSVLYAVLAALVQHADKSNLGNINSYIDQMSPEWHLLYTTTISKAKPALQSTSHWVKWLIEHQSTLT